MHLHYRKRTAPYGFPFLDSQTTHNLNHKANEAILQMTNLGYELVTPASLDYADTFFSEDYHYHSNTFHFRDNLGESLALRSDATVQIIKGFANFLENSQNKAERKFCYSVRVFRDIKKNYPALREIMQVGAEEIGVPEQKAIPNLILLASKIFQTALQEQLIVLAGDIRVYQFFAKFLQEHYSKEALRFVLLEKNIPVFADMLSQKVDQELSQQMARDLLLPPIGINWQEKTLYWKNKAEQKKQNLQSFFNELLNKMQPLHNLAKELKKENFELRIEPLLLRKTNYYSGILFEGYSKKLSQPPLRGGSYDKLVSHYSNSDLPASGFALDLWPF